MLLNNLYGTVWTSELKYGCTVCALECLSHNDHDEAEKHNVISASTPDEIVIFGC